MAEQISAWVTVSPDSILEEITYSLVRNDVEPSLVNVKSFNEMGSMV